jgi:hypothetical protein
MISPYYGSLNAVNSLYNLQNPIFRRGESRNRPEFRENASPAPPFPDYDHSAGTGLKIAVFRVVSAPIFKSRILNLAVL